ncbi:MAG: 30S ribosomal protein S8 [Actinobacteria bacterium]|jgi:small subunit ribosomal protein S8|nr:30S ribosomal protein S8 [Actinomycetota bacterium]MBE3114480.1 30S ribosomal protein S8 [Actinomycetota bacterium]MCJ7727061.1 30S ribosomal protein S8 [Actinomycetota bacterium]
MSAVTDPVSDMLTRIRNGYIAKLDSVSIPYSKLKTEIAMILDEEGYIRSYEICKDENVGGLIKVYLKYDKDKKSVITALKRISKPGLRVYAQKDEIPRVLGGLGTVILSTSKGVLTGTGAKKLGVGGEVICSIW